MEEQYVHICSSCQGENTHWDSGDLHRSPGWVPCSHCVNGKITEKQYQRNLKATMAANKKNKDLYNDKDGIFKRWGEYNRNKIK